jgi:hypothetical protein
VQWLLVEVRFLDTASRKGREARRDMATIKLTEGMRALLVRTLDGQARARFHGKKGEWTAIEIGRYVRGADGFVLPTITGDRVLNKMEDMGLVRTPRFSYSMRGPILSFYRLTGKGKKALAQVVRSEGRCKTVSV